MSPEQIESVIRAEERPWRRLKRVGCVFAVAVAYALLAAFLLAGNYGGSFMEWALLGGAVALVAGAWYTLRRDRGHIVALDLDLRAGTPRIYSVVAPGAPG